MLALGVGLSGCSGPYRQVSRGREFNRRLEACSFRELIGKKSGAGASEECAGARNQFDRLEQFRSYVKVAPVGPIIHELDLEYFCVVPHHVLVQVSGGDVTGLDVDFPTDEVAGAPPAVPEDIRQAVRRQLHELPESSDVRLNLRSTYRRLTAYEVIKHGLTSFTATATWKASPDLSRVLDPLPEVGEWDHMSLNDLGCAGRWLEFEGPPPLAAQSMLLNVAHRDQAALRRAFEAAVLENAKAQLASNSTNGASSLQANEQAFERLIESSNRAARAKIEQSLRILITAWRSKPASSAFSNWSSPESRSSSSSRSDRSCGHGI
jgi:hypothetical protein